VRRILVGRDWYEPISSQSILETEYEDSIRRYAESLFPGYCCVTFNKSVQSDYGEVKSDLALIDLNYRGWVVVEAELEHHSLARHVEPQMRRLVHGHYTDAHAEAMLKENPDLDADRLKRMIRTVDPEFLVVVPTETPEWRSTLSNLGVKIACVQVFASREGKRVVVHSGDRPGGWGTSFVSNLKHDQAFSPRALRVETPSAIPSGDSLDLLVNDYWTTWRVVKAQRVTYILPNGTLDLEFRKKLRLVRDSGGSLSIEEVKGDE
jgi:hypothetical protein